MPVNGGIDNKMAGFFQTVVLKYNPKDKQKKKSLVRATGEGIFRFNWKIGCKNNELQLPKELLWAYTD